MAQCVAAAGAAGQLARESGTRPEWAAHRPRRGPEPEAEAPRAPGAGPSKCAGPPGPAGPSAGARMGGPSAAQRLCRRARQRRASGAEVSKARGAEARRRWSEDVPDVEVADAGLGVALGASCCGHGGRLPGAFGASARAGGPPS